MSMTASYLLKRKTSKGGFREMVVYSGPYDNAHRPKGYFMVRKLQEGERLPCREIQAKEA